MEARLKPLPQCCRKRSLPRARRTVQQNDPPFAILHRPRLFWLFYGNANVPAGSDLSTLFIYVCFVGTNHYVPFAVLLAIRIVISTAP